MNSTTNCNTNSVANSLTNFATNSVTNSVTNYVTDSVTNFVTNSAINSAFNSNFKSAATYFKTPEPSARISCLFFSGSRPIVTFSWQGLRDLRPEAQKPQPKQILF